MPSQISTSDNDEAIAERHMKTSSGIELRDQGIN
jgi:hypothetical protein